MTSDQIVGAATTSWGVRALKGYLTYAETGTLADTKFTGREPDSDFELEVADAIRGLGFEVVAQLGVAGFYLDLAIKDPFRPDAFILGVECDGATYHSARVARDRDRLRQEILERLNWRIHRVWSTDWFRNRAAVITSLKNRLDDILRQEQEVHRQTVTQSSVHEAHSVLDEASPDVPTADATERESDHAGPPITVGEAHRLLIDLRERVLTRRFGDADRRKGLLRRSMIELLLTRRPTNLEEWTKLIPAYERQNTEERQLTFLGDVFKIIARIAN